MRLGVSAMVSPLESHNRVTEDGEAMQPETHSWSSELPHDCCIFAAIAEWEFIVALQGW